MINRLIEPTSGHASSSTASTRATIDAGGAAAQPGYAIQSVGLFPHLTVADNIATVPRLLGWDAARIGTACRGAARARRPRTRRVRAASTRGSSPAARRSASASRARWRPTRRCC